ncbi:hypothetical protein [Nostoc commune]|uniref:hypothetical protein n=1 Tax=Nostoc commune TaxID=1178 RepID=UPI0018C7CF23|nr:hypothetical protein [Nostoc commune]
MACIRFATGQLGEQIEVRQRAIELLERDVIPGIDYAITEIVHCKSENEIGLVCQDYLA